MVGMCVCVLCVGGREGRILEGEERSGFEEWALSFSLLPPHYLVRLPLRGTHPRTMGRLKSSLDTVAQVHRLVRLGGMPAPRWLDAAEK